MALSAVQYQALFTNAFGVDPGELGVEIDASGETVTGRANGHTVDLLVIADRAIEWRVDGETFAPWHMYAADARERGLNGDRLSKALATR